MNATVSFDSKIKCVLQSVNNRVNNLRFQQQKHYSYFFSHAIERLCYKKQNSIICSIKSIERKKRIKYESSPQTLTHFIT